MRNNDAYYRRILETHIIASLTLLIWHMAEVGFQLPFSSKITAKNSVI